MLIGVISDTHGVLRPRVLELFENVETILHAGDIGDPEILTQLESLAPVIAVCGNVDGFPLRGRLPDSRHFTLAGVRVFMTHIGGKPTEMRALYPEVRDSELVIFGHSHQPYQQWEGTTLFFNPGSAGPRRFSLPITVGLVTMHNTTASAEITHLSPS